MPTVHVGIAGAGLLGRLLAWRLAEAGHRVEVFDPAAGPAPRFDGHQAAGFTAAGMLSPLAEREQASARVAALGWRSIALWQALAARLRARPQVSVRGSLVLAHRGEADLARRLLARLPLPAAARPGPLATPADLAPEPSADGSADPPTEPPTAVPLSPQALATLEPALLAVPHAWLLPGEGQVDCVAMMQALHDEAPGVRWHWHGAVQAVRPGTLTLDGGSARGFDLVFDVRGSGGRPALPVRGVRGEVVWLHAPGHGLGRPLRLVHPRHRVYLVPRPGDLLLLGASEVESEDRSPVSLKTAVELMSAAHSVMPGLAESRIVRLDVNLRPALTDHDPRVDAEPGLVRINGLFRHGWLVAPALVEDVLHASALAPRAAGAVVP